MMKIGREDRAFMNQKKKKKEEKVHFTKIPKKEENGLEVLWSPHFGVECGLENEANWRLAKKEGKFGGLGEFVVF